MRVVIRLAIAATILVGLILGVLTLLGVFGQNEGGDTSNGNGSASTHEGALLPSPFTEASDLLVGLGLRLQSGVTQTANIIEDPRNDFDHPLRPRALPDYETDFAADISGWTSLESVEITDLKTCPLSGSEFACGDQEDYFVACGDEPEELTEGKAVIVAAKVVAAPKKTGDPKSRRFTLSLDDGNPDNNWQATPGNDNDFRRGFDSFFQVERAMNSADWSVSKTTVESDSSTVTGQTGARAIIMNKYIIILVPAGELPGPEDNTGQIAGGLISESFSSDLPGSETDFIADHNVAYNGDVISRFEPIFLNPQLKITCP